MHPEPFNPNSRLRASDSDREQAAAVINSALAEGRLSVTEHSDRLDKIYEAKTHAEIVPLIDDLPARGTATSPAPGTDLAPAAGRRRHMIIAIFGGASRKGPWHVEPKMSVVTVFGGAELDFRDVDMPREVTLHCTAVFGGMEIVVPPEVRVIDSGIAIFGGRDIGRGSEESNHPDAPVLRLTGFTMFGGLGAKHKPRRDPKDRKSRRDRY